MSQTNTDTPQTPQDSQEPQVSQNSQVSQVSQNSTAKEIKNVLLVVNPISGTHDKEKLVARILDRLGNDGFNVTLKYTTGPGDATTLALNAVKEDMDAVFACGGDGTINETARALRDTGVPLGIIPAGSGNGLARHLSIPIDPILSLDTLTERNIIDCDYGLLNGEHPFFCTFGVGFDAAVSHRFAKQKKRGRLSYIKSALEEFAHYDPQTYTIRLSDGQVLTEKAMIIAVCNASQYGNNAYIAPEASVTDGLLDITIVHAGNVFNTAIMGFDLVMGYLNRNVLIQNFKTTEATITRTSEGEAHIDGEPVIYPKDLHVKCHKGGLKLFCPTKQTDFQPILTPLKSTVNDWAISLRRLLEK